MLEFLEKYSGKIKINDELIEQSNFVNFFEKCSGSIKITLTPKNFVDKTESIDGKRQRFSFHVKLWMLEKSTDDFNFMQTWNNDKPMPLRYMTGTVEKETSRMYYVKVSGVPTKTMVCSRCGKTLTNSISKWFGIGPECSQKLGINPRVFITEQYAKEQLSQIEEQIRNTRWEGWLPKTAILEMIEI